MRRSLPLLHLGSALTIASLVVLAACSSDPSPPPAQPVGTPGPGASSTTDPPTTPTTTGTTQPPPPPVSEWVAPKVATTSPACGTPQGQAIHADFTTASGRKFHVWGPSGYDPNKTYPVVLMFHGWYADGAAFESWFEMEKYVDNAAFVVYPDAVGGLWDLNGDTDLLFFDEMVKQLGETYCINPSRVLGFGFSYGAIFMNRLGCKRAGYVKAISIGDGDNNANHVDCGRLPVLVTARTKDTNEVIAGGRAAAASWVALNSCAAGTDVSDGPMSYPPSAVAGAVSDQPQNCITQQGCKSPGAVTFCEDSWFDPTWQADWNHTVREPYRTYTWRWFNALP